MDVIMPETYWVGNRCYRRNPSRNGGLGGLSNNSDRYWENEDEAQISTQNPSKTEVKPYVEEEDYSCDPEAPDEIDLNYDIEEIDNGNGFKIRCNNIPSSMFPIIVGKKGLTKQRIENETRTKLVIPRPNEKGDMVIRGRNRKDVISCKRRLDLMASQSRFKRDITHFVCFPVNSPDVIAKVNEFRKIVLKECANNRGVDEMIFLEPEKSHLTLCVAVLMDERERQMAEESLINIQQELTNIFNKEKLTVHLRELEIMNDDPTQVDVLYAKCKCDSEEDKQILQDMSDFIAKRFAASGFAKDNRGEHVKLHCTVMNTRKRVEILGQPEDGNEEGEKSRGYIKRETFDASLILSKFKDFDFGTVDVTEIRLATRFTTAPDGFYKSYCSVKL